MADYTKVDLVIKHMELAANEAATIYRQSFVDRFGSWIKTSDKLGSPAEAVFVLWWRALESDITHARWDIDGDWNTWEPRLRLRPQVDVKLESKTYRLDFAVEPHPMSECPKHWAQRKLAWKPIAVEIDGHEWHEKTKEQATNRNERDRLLQQAGWQVFHFSFSELVSKPMDCVSEVAYFAEAQFDNLNYTLIDMDAEDRRR